MNLRRIPRERIHTLFRILVVAALLAAFAQVTLGGVVRVTDSGLGCPDWPLCHGKLIPPFELTTLIEYSHRLSASVLSLMVLATSVLAWKYYRSRFEIVAPATLALFLVIVAALLGGVTVLTELAWWVVLVHLGIAELLITSLAVASIAAWYGDKLKRYDAREGSSAVRPSDLFQWLVVATAVGVFLLILSGSYMVGYGAGSSCATWPLCRGSLLPSGTIYAIHMGHRYVAGLVGLLIIATAIAAWRMGRHRPDIRLVGLLLLVAFAIQIIVGAAVVWAKFVPEAKALHLSVATLVWLAASSLFTVVFYPNILRIAPERRRVTTVSKLEGLTS